MVSLSAQTEIAENPNTHGTMLMPVGLGADKTTVTVGTGNQDFHPMYTFVGNIHNEMRKAHRDAVTPVAFLPIAKGVFHTLVVLYSYSLARSCRRTW